MKRNIKYKRDCSEEYKDLVDKLLQSEPSKRLPLILVFDHPWVKKFQEKYNLKKAVASASSVAESPSSRFMSKEEVPPSSKEEEKVEPRMKEGKEEGEEEKKVQTIKQIEEITKKRRYKKGYKNGYDGEDAEIDNVYDLCDQMMHELSYLDAQLEHRDKQ